jgi:hypothetical protein
MMENLEKDWYVTIKTDVKKIKSGLSGTMDVSLV